MDRADRFILADTLQYSRQSYQNRALLRTPDGSQWMSIPLRGRQHGRPICEVEIHGTPNWIRKHWRALTYNYRATPFFEYYADRLQPVFDTDWVGLADLTSRTVELIRALLGIRTPLIRASDLEGAPDSVPDVMDAVGDTHLLVPRIALSSDRLLASSVLDFEETERHQHFDGFEPDTSALDILFNYGPEALGMIRRQRVVTDAR
jgi:hypothetical protein